MISFEINQTEFQLIHLTKDVFQKDMLGHSHSANSYELHFITDGHGTLTTDTELYPLQKGDFFVTGPNVYHQQSTDPTDPMVEISVYLQANSPKKEDALVCSFLQTHFYICHQPQLGEMLELLIREQTQKAFGYQTAIAAILQQLIVTLSRLYLPQQTGKALPLDTLNDKRFLIIEEAFIYHADKVTLAWLAQRVGLCERQVQRLLQKYYGMSFRQKKQESHKK